MFWFFGCLTVIGIIMFACGSFGHPFKTSERTRSNLIIIGGLTTVLAYTCFLLLTSQADKKIVRENINNVIMETE